MAGITKMPSSLLILSITLPAVPLKRATSQVMTDDIQSRGGTHAIDHRHTQPGAKTHSYIADARAEWVFMMIIYNSLNSF